MTDTFVLNPEFISPGYSQESDNILTPVGDAYQKREIPALTSLIEQARDSLAQVYAECSTDNWDGAGASAIPLEAYKNAERYLNILITDGLPLPEISPDDFGAIEFDWSNARDSLYTLTFYGNDLIGYSAVFGSDEEKYGTQKFIKTVPPSIMRDISRFL